MATLGETPRTQESKDNSPVRPPRPKADAKKKKVSGRRDTTIMGKHDSTGKQQTKRSKALQFIGKLSGKNTAPQPRETCVLIVNRKHVSEENERAFRDGLINYLYKDVQEEGNKIKFHVKIDDLLKAVEAVQKKREMFSQTTVTSKDAQVVVESKSPLSQGIKSPGVKGKKEKFCRHLSHHEYNALEYLLGKNFTNAVKSVVKNNGEIVSICAKNKADKESIDHWLSNLRQESLTLTSEELGKLGGSVDTKSAGVKAFIAVQNNDCSVVIHAFDYNAIKTAKHIVEVKSEKRKLTKHGRPDVVIHTNHTVVEQTKDLYTKSGIKVSVYKADITLLPVDAIVNAANGQLNHGGGVAAVISRAAGVNLQLEGDDYVKDHGPLKVTEVLSTTAGNLPCKKVIHAVGPRWNDYKNKNLCQTHLKETVFNCLTKANEMKFTSLAVSSISSAIFGVPKETCARMYLAGIQKFDRQHGGNTSLKHIHFVDVNDEMVGIIQKVFTQLWHGDFQPFLFQSQSKNKSKQNSKPVQVNSSQLRQSEFPKNSKRSDGGNTRHFDFKGITLFLQQHAVTHVPDDVAMVVWQEPGHLKIETGDWFKLIGSSSGESIPIFENINEGDVKTFTARNGRTILFSAMSSQTIDETKVSGILKTILDKVQRESKRSVVIPSSPYVNQTESNTNNNRLEQFCEGIYKGFQHYLENILVYVTVDNADILEAMAEKIRLLHGEGMGVEKSRSHEEKHCIELPRITIVIKQEESKSESIQRLMDESVRQYVCECQIEPRVCLEIISQNINKFIEALKHICKLHTTEKDKPQVDQQQECECGDMSFDRKKYDALRHVDKDVITSNFTEELPRITIVIKQEEAKSESIQRIVNESVRQYDCKCQSEPRVCLEMKSQDINKFIEALKHASKPHTTEKDKPQVGQHQECECGDISLDRKKYDALRHLDKDFITSNFTEVNEQQAIEDSAVVTLRPNTTSHSEQLQLLLSSLRIEEMNLSSDEFETFTHSSDISSTDRDFFILSEHNEGKVTVYARNYQAMTTAMHTISIIIGKKKITTRYQRKFSNTSDPTTATSDSGDSEQSYA